jgi:hypothetical protein
MIIKGLLHADRKRKVERKEMTRAFWTAADKIWRMSKTSRFPGTTNTFIAFNSGMNSTQDLSRAFGNLIDLEGYN